MHITPTNIHPDLVWWDDIEQSVFLAELTVCCESNFVEAAQRKVIKYADLIEQLEDSGCTSTL